MHRPVDELHRKAHLHHGAHLPPGKFRLLHKVHVLQPGLLGLNEEEGGQKADGSSAVQRAQLDGSAWGAAG